MRTRSGNSTLVWTLLLASAIAALLVPWQAAAQVLYGSVVGNVTDPSGGNIPAANVTITNKQTNLSRETTTDADGVFSLLAIPTGTYTIRVTKSGFKAFENTEVPDRKSTRLNSSHSQISYAVFCLKKKNNIYRQQLRCMCHLIEILVILRVVI